MWRTMTCSHVQVCAIYPLLQDVMVLYLVHEISVYNRLNFYPMVYVIRRQPLIRIRHIHYWVVILETPYKIDDPSKRPFPGPTS
jgi:hypothetical protein